MSLPWFKFEPKPFISDTLRLSTEAKGAYLMLILDYYDQGKPAPDDDDTLATITGLSVEVWRRHRRVIEPLFSIRDGLWYHNKCEEVLAEQTSSYQQRVDASKAAAEARRLKRLARSGGKPSGASTDTPSGQPGDTSFGAPSGDRPVEPDFGPSNRSDDRPIDRAVHRPDNRAVENTESAPTDAPSGAPSDTSNGQPDGQQNRRIEEGIREGANAPSPASVGFDLIGSLVDPAFQPTKEVLIEAMNTDGVSATDLSVWLNDWKQRCMDDGTRSTDWHAAWGREYHRRMQERAKNRPKPRVAVTRKRLTTLPENWAPNERHHELAQDRKLDIALCVESFADHITNKRPDWSDADAAFRNWLKSPHRTEFTRNGQAQPARRAPAPGGSSILDAGARFEQRLDAELARGRAPTQDQQDGDAAVLSLPEE